LNSSRAHRLARRADQIGRRENSLDSPFRTRTTGKANGLKHV